MQRTEEKTNRPPPGFQFVHKKPLAFSVGYVRMQVRYNSKKEVFPMAAVVDASKCVSCGVCVDTCPMSAITMEDTAVVDAGACVDCGACAGECPQEAIELQ